MAKNTINVPTSAEFDALEARVTTSERTIIAGEGRDAVQDTRLASAESQETNSVSRITALESRAAKVEAALSLFGGAALDDAAPAAALLDAIEATDNSTDTALDIRIRLEVAMPNDTTRRSLLIAGLLSTVSYGALAKPHFMRGGKDSGGPIVVPTILSVSLSNSSFNGGAADGTVVGTIAVQMSIGTFAGSLSLTGADAADFEIVGSNLVTQGVLSDGTYSLNIVATQGDSSVTLPVTITGAATPVVVDIANTVAITDRSGSPQTDYPLRFGRPFAEGEIDDYPQAVLNGLAVVTQATVKNRWPDGSVRYAILAPEISSLPASTRVELTFQNQATGNETALSKAEMLDAAYDFDAEIRITRPAYITGVMETTLATWKAVTNGSLAIEVDGVVHQVTGLNFASVPAVDYYVWQVIDAKVRAANVPFRVYHVAGQGFVAGGTSIIVRTPDTGTNISPLLLKSGVTTTPRSSTVSASARTMLDAGAYTAWTPGQVAQEVIIADHSATRAYDIGFSVNKSFRPSFNATFFPASGKVKIDVIGEITNSQFLEALIYDLEIWTGDASPQLVYSQANVAHSLGTRWKRTLWIGGTPEHRINIAPNIAYLAATKAVPNYDASVVVSESAIASEYDWWQTYAVTSIGGTGRWMTTMSAPGERSDIGPTTTWNARYLYTGDYRTRAVALGQADLAGSWAYHIREGSSTKNMNKAGTVPGIGRPVSVYARPTSWLLDMRAPGNTADKLTIFSPRGSNTDVDMFFRRGWSADAAHQPDPFHIPYVLTGDYYYLEQLQMWAGYGSFDAAPGTGASSRGPGAGIYNQTRGEAWLLRNRVNAAQASPDADPMKAVFEEMISDAIAKWEGQRNITGTALQGTPMWTFGHSFLGTTGDGWLGLGIPPLRWWSGSTGYAATNPAYYNTAVTLSAAGFWMDGYLGIWLGRAVELGYAADALVEWIEPNVAGRALAPSNPYLNGQYVYPNVKKGPLNGAGQPTPQWFESWAETLTGWSNAPNTTFPPNLRASTNIFDWPSENGTTFVVARCAAALVSDIRIRPDIWAAFDAVVAAETTRTGKSITFGNDPRWAIVARGA